MAGRSQSITATSSSGVRHQSMSGPPVQEMVTVAVLPPRLPENMAAPTGIGTADAFAWDEALNWSHNQKINQAEPEATGPKKWMRKMGVTTQRQKANDMPPFRMRKVPYDTWRKHYAKDKDGRYQGTGTPAEDCLLLPEDVEKWRLGEPETKADQWTRGKEALPGYGDARTTDAAPAYSETAEVADSEIVPTFSTRSQRSGSSFTADGKSSEQIIQEAMAKAEAKKKEGGGWKNAMKRGAEYSIMGGG